MWENSGYDNAGGFYNESQGGETKTPGGTDRKRANNIVPVTIRDILDSGKFTIPSLCNPNSSFRICSFEKAKMV